MTTSISARCADGVGWLRLEGPDRLNAIGSSTYEALADAVRNFEHDVNVGAVIIHGLGAGFSAGADIEEITAFQTRGQFYAFLQGFTAALDVIASSPLPIIAAVHGPALGGGLELALACDLRVVARDSRLGLPEAKLGVLPGAGGTQRLPRTIPVGIAAEMLMTGEPISGERAYELGLANRVTTADSLLQTATELAAGLLHIAPQAVSATKSLLTVAGSKPLLEGIEAERDVVSDLFDSPAGRAGFNQFGERRSNRHEENENLRKGGLHA